MSKYKLTDATKQVGDTTFFRIQALKDFSNVKAGVMGGWVEKESNLSQDGDCWISGSAMVSQGAMVSGNARVFAKARVYDNALVYGNARVSENASIFGDARVFGNAQVYGNARVFENAWVYGNARVCGDARVFDNAMVYGDVRVYNQAMVGEQLDIKYSSVTSVLCARKNILQNIEAQTGLVAVGGYVICFKHVNADLTSMYDNTFQYVIGEEAEAQHTDESDKSCSRGLHVSHASYWNGRGGKVRIMCRVHVDDIITVQDGKIRCRKLFVIGKCDGDVF